MTELPEGYFLRRPLAADLDSVVALMIACDIADSGHPDTTPDDVRADWALPHFDLSRDTWIVVAPDGSIVGYAWAWERVPHSDVQGDVYVRPDCRLGAVTPVLLRLLEERSRDLAAAGPTGSVTKLAIFARPTTALAALLESREYECARTFLRMTIDLGLGYPATQPLQGIEIRPFRRGLDERHVQSAIEESFADHFRFAPEDPKEWVARRFGHPEFDPDLWLVAWEGEEAVGAILPYHFTNLGWIRELGVRPAWRGRGVGKALLLESFRVFENRGQHRVSLGVDAANTYGATRFYETVGMREEERHDLYQKSLRAANLGSAGP